MEEDLSKKTKVEQLDHFPFHNFQEFNKAVFEGVAHPGVDRGVALQWSQGGKYAPTSLRLMNTFFTFLPFLAALGFIVFAIATRTWLLLIALPVLFIAFFIFHPGSAMIFGPTRSLFILMSFGGLGYGIYKGILSLMCQRDLKLNIYQMVSLSVRMSGKGRESSCHNYFQIYS